MHYKLRCGSASPKKNCGYSLLDRIVYGDAGRWGHTKGGTAAEKRCTPTFNRLSDSGVRRDYMAVACAYLPHDAVVIFVVGVFFFGVADFFFAKRLFFRNGEGGEWRAWRATVGVKAKDNGGACFTLDFGITHTIGRQPSPPHRGDFLFFSIHP